MTCEKHSGLERQNRPAISCQRNTPRSSNTIMQMMFQHHRCPNTSVESLLLRSCQLYQGLVLLDVSMVLVPSFRNLWFNSESSRVQKQGKEFKGLSAVTWFFQRWHPQISTNELCTNMPRAGGAQLVRRERRWSCWLNNGYSLFSWRKNAWPTCSMHAFFQNDDIIRYMLTYIHHTYIQTFTFTQNVLTNNTYTPFGKLINWAASFFNLLHRSKVQPILWPRCAWIASGKGVARDTCGSKKLSYSEGLDMDFFGILKLWCMKSHNGFAFEWMADEI